MKKEQSKPVNNTDNKSGSSQDQRGARRKRAKRSIPSVDEILYQLLELNGAVTMGAISTKEANLIQKNLRTILDVQMKRSNREETGPTQEGLVELCRRDPQALNVIESFLTDSQFEWLMNEVKDDSDDDAV